MPLYSKFKPSSVTTIIPFPPTMTAGLTRQYNSSITAYLGLMNIPYNITVNKIITTVTASAAGGSYLFGLYTESGQQQVLSTVIPSISANTSFVGTVTSVLVNAGNYYSAVVPKEGRSDAATFDAWNTSTAPTTTLNVYNRGPIYSGRVSVTAGTLPTTFNPNTIASVAGQGIAFRLDN